MLDKMKYKKVYTAADLTEAHFIKGLLIQYDIELEIQSQSLAIAIGELPVDAQRIDLYVKSENLSKSLEILSKYNSNIRSSNKLNNWKCNHCNEENPESFEICWSCNK